MSTYSCYSTRPSAYTRMSEGDSGRQQPQHHSHSYPTRPNYNSSSTPGDSEDIHHGWNGWQNLNLEEAWRTSWLGRAVETMQIKWWHYKTGIGALESERGVEESEYRRDERLVAASEGRPYHYDS